MSTEIDRATRRAARLDALNKAVEAANNAPFDANDPNVVITRGDEPRPSFVLSAKVDYELARAFYTEVERRGVKPSDLIREYLAAGLANATRQAHGEAPVNLDRLRAALGDLVPGLFADQTAAAA